MPADRRTAAVNKSARRSVKPPATVQQIVDALDRAAPFAGAEPWDNVGLLAGARDWPARHTLITLDLTDIVVDEVLRKEADVVVCYHPPIFKGAPRLTAEAPGPTNRLPDLLARGVSIIATHTAFDAAVGGTNDLLLDAFELADRAPLTPRVVEHAAYKLVVFVPPAEAADLRARLSDAGAGVIGNYDQCSYELHGRGSFRGDESTNPTVGQRNQLEFVDEARLEMVLPKRRLGEVVRTLYASHSYEEPAFDLYPVAEVAGRGQVGMGRVGNLRRPTNGRRLVEALAEICDLSVATVVGDLKRTYRRIVAAAGSFGVDSFRDPDALYLTGEFKHHDALALQRRGVTAIAIGHWNSEQPVLNALRSIIKDEVGGAKVAVTSKDRSPFQPLS